MPCQRESNLFLLNAGQSWPAEPAKVDELAVIHEVTSHVVFVGRAHSALADRVSPLGKLLPQTLVGINDNEVANAGMP